MVVGTPILGEGWRLRRSPFWAQCSGIWDASAEPSLKRTSHGNDAGRRACARGPCPLSRSVEVSLSNWAAVVTRRGPSPTLTTSHFSTYLAKLSPGRLVNLPCMSTLLMRGRAARTAVDATPVRRQRSFSPARPP